MDKNPADAQAGTARHRPMINVLTTVLFNTGKFSYDVSVVFVTDVTEAIKGVSSLTMKKFWNSFSQQEYAV